MKKFKPFLAPNESVDLNNTNYPILASYKLDGYRCIFYKGEILTRSLKQVQNKQLREKFEPIRKYTEDNNCILDGEVYSHKLTFQELNKFFMSEDLESKRSIKRYGKVLTLPVHVKFYAFDCIIDDNLEEEFFKRCLKLHKIIDKFKDISEYVTQTDLYKKENIELIFDKALENGYEGLILKDPNGRYKCGRGTIKEGLIYKVKPFVTFDAEILHVVQATEVDPNAEKKINELGRSVTSKKKGDRVLINKASAFEVEYEGKRLKVVIAMTDEEKEAIWAKKSTYIGRTIEYKGMMIGSKDVPRHPVMIRFREDKE